MRRIFAAFGLRLVIELKTCFEELNETRAMSFRCVSLTNAGGAAIHANLNNRLIVGNFQVTWLRNNRRNLE